MLVEGATEARNSEWWRTIYRFTGGHLSGHEYHPNTVLQAAIYLAMNATPTPFYRQPFIWPWMPPQHRFTGSHLSGHECHPNTVLQAAIYLAMNATPTP